MYAFKQDAQQNHNEETKLTFFQNEQTNAYETRPSHMLQNETSFNQSYYYNLPQAYYPQYAQNYLQPNPSHQYNFNQYSSYGVTNSTSRIPLPVYHTSPVSQSTSPALHQNTSSTATTVTTPTNSNFKLSYLYPTPPSDNVTILSNTSSPTELKANTSVQSAASFNEDVENKMKESLKPKEKNGKLVRRRNRVQFTQQQVDTMEAIFDKSHYPEVHVIDRLSDKLGISIERLSIWFQNRRAKFKKAKRPASDTFNDHKSSFSNNVENRARDIDSIISKYSDKQTESDLESRCLSTEPESVQVNQDQIQESKSSNFGFNTDPTYLSNFYPTM